jgi:hypothetical protein
MAAHSLHPSYVRMFLWALRFQTPTIMFFFWRHFSRLVSKPIVVFYNMISKILKSEREDIHFCAAKHSQDS